MATIQFWISLQRDAFIKSYASAQLEAFKKWPVKKEADIPDFMMEMLEQPVFPEIQRGETARAAEDLLDAEIACPSCNYIMRGNVCTKCFNILSDQEKSTSVDNNPHNEIDENIFIKGDTLKNLDEVFEPTTERPINYANETVSYLDEDLEKHYRSLDINDNLDNSDFISKVED